MVAIEQNYSQGSPLVLLNARVSTFVDKITDLFEIRPLEIQSLATLSEVTNVISELVVMNNLNSAQAFTWRYESGQQNITSNLTNITGNQLFVFIASNYTTSGVFRTLAVVNSSSYYDNQTAVVVS